MQSNTPILNFGINLSNLAQFQIPILLTPPIILNGIDVQTFQNFGGTSLPNASKNSLQTIQKEGQGQKNSKQTTLKRPSTDKKTNWSQEEDQILKHLVQEQKLEWVQIVKRIPNRTYKMCYSRYQRIKEEKKVNWSQAEENKIRQLVSLFGKRWKHISQLIPNRTPKQIRERYLNYLRPNISHDKWSMEEDLQLITLIQKYGRRWKTIERHMNKRSQNQLKNRFYGKLKKGSRKSNGSEIKVENSSLSG